MKNNAADFSSPTNFVDHLCRLARHNPDATALIVVSERQNVTVDTVISYAELYSRVRNLAAELSRQFKKGDRVLLLLDNDDHYVVGFFACLFAGLVAVPAFPPLSHRAQQLARLAGIVRDAEAAGALVVGGMQSMLASSASAWSNIVLIAADASSSNEVGDFEPCRPSPEDIAFLQYTSGSTSAPKGVMVTHANLIANERAIERSLQITVEDVFVSWLPLYHDMGLIGGLLQPLHRVIPVVLMTPQYFLEKPVRWLEAISRLGGTVSGGPDFSFRLCLERISDEQLSQLNLASWRIAFSGAEPVRKDTLDGFGRRFSAAGFTPSALYPCYGLAEATLLVTGSRPGEGVHARIFSTTDLAAGVAKGADIGTTLVSCGDVVHGHLVSIVDPQSHATLEEGRVGEIWVSGPSVTKGYWNRPDATISALVTRDDRQWLRTGDIGFLLDGELYVAGRIKDTIIVRGHNLFPQDIEQAVEAQVEVVRKGRVAAFAVESSEGEGIGIAVELSRNMQKLIAPDALRELIDIVVSEQCGDPARALVLLNPGALPKTTSGKLQRSACKSDWRNFPGAYAIFFDGKLISTDGENSVASNVETSAQDTVSDAENELADIWRDVLGVDEGTVLKSESNFFSCGGNSLAATRLISHVGNVWRVDFTLSELFELPRLGALSQEIQRRRRLTSPADPIAIAQLSSDQRQLPQPVSPAQERQWVLWRLAPTSTAYHIGSTVHLNVAVSSEALQASFEALMIRHEALRTSFHQDVDGQVKQVIGSGSAVPWFVFDLRDCVGQQSVRLQKTLQNFNEEAFDLTQGPLWRAALIRLADDNDIIVLVMHHIIADGCSLQILVDELAHHYAEYLNGRLVSPVERKTTLDYVDHAHWQRNWLSSDDAVRQLTWWRHRLGTDHPPLLLPTDRPRAAGAAYQAKRHCIVLPASLLPLLRARAHAEAATLFMVLLAGFQCLLHRYTGVSDIRVGIPVANRRHIETLDVVGLFVNTVVQRNFIEGSMSLAQVLSSIREMALAAQQYQDLPFNVLVDALQPQRSLTQSPLFQVMFNYLHEDFRALKKLSDKTTAIRIQSLESAAQYELVLEAREQFDGSLQLEIVYAAELFDGDTIERMAGHYVNLLQAVAEQPWLGVGEVELLTAEEQSTLMHWGVNGTRHEQAEPVHRLFERCVQAQPDATALIFGAEAISYGELNRRANQLAHHLIARGVGIEVKIGVAMRRSIEMVVALLGVLKAGAAYVPLDPEYPSERLAYMIDDSGITLLLTQAALREQLPLPDVLPVLTLDDATFAHDTGANPLVEVSGDNLAYIIYTSGSTGRPKGAANRHGSLVSCMQWMQQTYQLGATDTVLHKAPFGFDVSVWELFWPLSTGVRLVIAEPDDHRDPRVLADLIRQHGITVVNFVPAMLQAYLARVDVEHQSSLKYILCGGEAMTAALLRKTRERLPNCRLQNLYGPTEAAIHVTRWECAALASSTIPIGRPISAAKTLVLDADLNLVPQGVPGELYLGGIGLGRGYLGKAGLTAERFIADPFDTAGARLYRTGDQARWNAEGLLEYLGRIDHQLKIRGFRIEPGEIEAQLLAQPGVREAIVIATGEAASARLLAYVSAQEHLEIDGAALRLALAQTLPDYMVPAAIEVLSHLPLSPNGKIDRKALPAVANDAERGYETPCGDIENALAQIWSRVLDVARIGRHDNFFDLGGNSLLLTQVQQALEQQLAVMITMTDLFRYPTVEALAVHLAQQPSERFRDIQQQDNRAARQRNARLQRRQQLAEAR